MFTDTVGSLAHKIVNFMNIGKGMKEQGKHRIHLYGAKRFAKFGIFVFYWARNRPIKASFDKA